jgi:hypothetical protein
MARSSRRITRGCPIIARMIDCLGGRGRQDADLFACWSGVRLECPRVTVIPRHLLAIGHATGTSPVPGCSEAELSVWLPAWLPRRRKSPSPWWRRVYDLGALGGTRTPNLLIRSQMLYPLSYERGCLASLRHSGCALRQHFAVHSPAAARVAATDADMSSTTWLSRGRNHVRPR